MKSIKALSFSIIAMIFAFWLVACDQGPAEDAGEEIDETVEQASDQMQEGSDQMQESMEEMEEETDQQ
jgi:hypothetical protein